MADITVNIETGPGGRHAYLDCGEHRMMVWQNTGNFNTLTEPLVHQAHSVGGELEEAKIIRDLFNNAIDIAERWSAFVGTKWTEPQ